MNMIVTNVLMAFISVWILSEVLLYSSLRFVGETSSSNSNSFIWILRSMALLLLATTFVAMTFFTTVDIENFLFYCFI